jgi:hypothetical protein
VLEHCVRVNCWRGTDSSTCGYKDRHMARCCPISKREKLTRTVDFTRQKDYWGKIKTGTGTQTNLTPATAARENETQTPDTGDE